MAVKNRVSLANDLATVNATKNTNLVATVDIVDLNAIYSADINLLSDAIDSSVNLASNSTFVDTSGVVTLNTGSVNGVNIGGATTNKVGFFGVTPVVQPSESRQESLIINTGGSYGSTLDSLNLIVSSPADNTGSSTTTNTINAVSDSNTGVTTVLADAAQLADLNTLAGIVNDNNHEFIRTISSIELVLSDVQNSIQTLAERDNVMRDALVSLGIIKGTA